MHNYIIPVASTLTHSMPKILKSTTVITKIRLKKQTLQNFQIKTLNNKKYILLSVENEISLSACRCYLRRVEHAFESCRLFS